MSPAALKGRGCFLPISLFPSSLLRKKGKSKPQRYAKSQSFSPPLQGFAVLRDTYKQQSFDLGGGSF